MSDVTLSVLVPLAYARAVNAMDLGPGVYDTPEDVGMALINELLGKVGKVLYPIRVTAVNAGVGYVVHATGEVVDSPF